LEGVGNQLKSWSEGGYEQRNEKKEREIIKGKGEIKD
jgi:hypothetical protein